MAYKPSGYRKLLYLSWILELIYRREFREHITNLELNYRILFHVVFLGLGIMCCLQDTWMCCIPRFWRTLRIKIKLPPVSSYDIKTRVFPCYFMPNLIPRDTTAIPLITKELDVISNKDKPPSLLKISELKVGSNILL